MLKNRRHFIGTLIVLIIGVGFYWQSQSHAPASYRSSADIIKHTYERDLFTLSAYKKEHYGLRMFRQTQDPKYLPLVRQNIADISIKLNQLASDLTINQSLDKYAEQRLSEYRQSNGERSQRRLQVTQDKPEYFYLGLDLLHYMARIDGYGLQHKDDALFRQQLKGYPFQALFTDQEMTKAWAAQLANQAYWLKQLQLGDYVELFTQTLQRTYPDKDDRQLTTEQYENKIYGMTHLIIADSGYYQRQVNEQDHPWIFAYFKQNIDDIIANTKQDVISEVGISLLLAGLDNDPAVEKARQAIQHSIDKQAGLVPSAKGSTDYSHGEHRNLLAILLLDWHTPTPGPNTTTTPDLFTPLPYGLQKKP
ncbi:hypothetical protein VHA01S_012_00430 [Vibrio halioticoli NBRC 102217]|uniref:DUF3541 domain-containing protein n=1 Tax=Vibrio halioticoli NBRC 102217 TaxID=1219072 RepID=V5FIZ9_9VIBR|nr:DUF3541 domain-containing protein [Vibrio halioticoli]GAD88927.1 hypothetical protein VHA01S_012_00430 [Vibrio halioticoli NBRC 102217]